MDWRRAATRVVALAAVCALPALVGCQNFFQCEGKASCGGSDSGSSSSNVIFAGNSSTGSTYINAYTNTSGTLAAVSGSPYSLGFTPSAMVARIGNSYLFVASTTGYIYSYTISSAGVLSGSTAQATPGYPQASMDVTPDGKWLVSIDSSSSTSPILHVYSIGSSATLTETTQVTLYTTSGYSIVPKMVRVSPDNSYIAVANGSGGTEVIPFTTSNGTTGTVQYINTASAADGDNAIVWDSSDRLYLARTISGTATSYSVWVYSASSASMITTTGYTTGAAPLSMTFSSGDSYLYVGNKNDSTISMFSQSDGTLTSLGTVAAPSTVSAMTTDQTGKYVIAAGYDSSAGLEVFAVGSSGALTLQSTTAATGTSTSVTSTVTATH